MYLANVKQMQSIDKLTINQGIPGIILMENAGICVANEAFYGTDKKYTVVCGSGNNGGDGSVAARHLLSMGANVVLILICPVEKLKNDAKTAFEMAVNFGVPVIEGICYEVENRLNESDIIIDAVLGIGSQGSPRDEAKSVINQINTTNAKIISVDVPSGINCDNGQVYEDAVDADVTVTFGIGKIGLYMYPARDYAGETKVVNIGFLPDAIKKQGINVQTIDHYHYPYMLNTDFKGTRGKTLVVAGSLKYSGAAYMPAVSALRSGSGLVTLVYPNDICCHYTNICPELISATAPSSDGFFSREASSFVINLAHDSNSVVIGCGMGVTEGTKKIVMDLISNYKKTLVLDADGINCIAKNKNILKNSLCNIIITPHIGEMAKLLDKSSKEVSENMLEIAKNVADEYNIIVVLKSATTVIAQPGGMAYINTFGTPGMATAGSGDVLSGIIGGFAAQGMSAFDAAVNGVAVHAMSGAVAAKAKGKHYMNATDIIDAMSLLDLKGRGQNDA